MDAEVSHPNESLGSALSGKRIFLTGGTGYLGSNLLRRLKQVSERAPEAISVTALSRDPERFLRERPELVWAGLRMVHGDVADFSLSEGALAFDGFLHGGNSAEVPRDAESEMKFREAVLRGTTNAFARIRFTPGARAVLMGSGAAQTPGSDPYARAKAESETLFVAEAGKHAIAPTIARIFTVAGAYLPLEGRFALGQFVRQARDTGEIAIGSGGRARRSYLAGNELADWLLHLLVRGAAPSPEKSVFDVGSDDAISIAEVAETVRSVFAARGKTVRVRIEGKMADGPDYLPNLAAIRSAYGLKPVKSSIQAVRDATEWVLDER